MTFLLCVRIQDGFLHFHSNVIDTIYGLEKYYVNGSILSRAIFSHSLLLNLKILYLKQLIRDFFGKDEFYFDDAFRRHRLVKLKWFKSAASSSSAVLFWKSMFCYLLNNFFVSMARSCNFFRHDCEDYYCFSEKQNLLCTVLAVFNCRDALHTKIGIDCDGIVL
jgi:hypothetical protein